MPVSLEDAKKLDLIRHPVIATHAKLDAERVLTDLIKQVEGIKNKLKILRDHR